jgi:hypothetical protein
VQGIETENFMKLTKRLTNLALLAIASFTVSTVQADDTLSQSAPTHKQLMKDCIRKHQAGDVNLSKSQLSRICEDELKQQKITGSPPPAPTSDGPQAPQTPPP